MTTKTAEQLHGELEHAQRERVARHARYYGTAILLGLLLLGIGACAEDAQSQPADGTSAAGLDIKAVELEYAIYVLRRAPHYFVTVEADGTVEYRGAYTPG